MWINVASAERDSAIHLFLVMRFKYVNQWYRCQKVVRRNIIPFGGYASRLKGYHSAVCCWFPWERRWAIVSCRCWLWSVSFVLSIPCKYLPSPPLPSPSRTIISLIIKLFYYSHYFVLPLLRISVRDNDLMGPNSLLQLWRLITWEPVQDQHGSFVLF